MGMRFSILGSGSSGNCALLEVGATRVLIDAGFSGRKTGQLLAAVGASLDQIDAIFLTHEHGDHASALSGLARFPAIKIFANAATARVVQAGIQHRADWQIFETGSRFQFRDLEIQSFSVPHDAQEPVGFVFSTGNDDLFSKRQQIAWLTDLGHAPRHVQEHIRPVDVVVVEANHCSELLKADVRRPWSVKQRICGRHGHLSNQRTRELLETVAGPQWQHIYLTHLSRDCNSREAVQQAFTNPACSLRCPFSIVAPGESTPFYELS